MVFTADNGDQLFSRLVGVFLIANVTWRNSLLGHQSVKHNFLHLTVHVRTPHFARVYSYSSIHVGPGIPALHSQPSVSQGALVHCLFGVFAMASGSEIQCLLGALMLLVRNMLFPTPLFGACTHSFGERIKHLLCAY